MRTLHIVVAAAILAVLAVVPIATGAKGGTERPFHATLTGLVTYDFPGRCVEVTTVTESDGEATHLGRVHASWSHCPVQPNGDNDGTLTIVAANGDELHAVYDWPPPGDGNDIPITITGGTGRFANATGEVVATYDAVPQFIAGCNPVPDPFPCFDFATPWPWWATITGTIGY